MRRISFISLLAVTLSATSAHAVTLGSNATLEIDGGAVLSLSDPKSGPPPGTLVSEVMDTRAAPDTDVRGISGFPAGDFDDLSGARAVNAGGITRVLADGVFFDGLSVDHVLTASTSFSETVTNTTGGAADFFYDFFVFGPQLILADFAGASPGMTGAPTASFMIDIKVDGGTIWSTSATLNGGLGGTVLTESGTDPFSGTVTNPASGIFEVLYPDFSTDLLLGNFADGDSFTLDVDMSATVSAFGFELGGLAAIGDPGDISSDPATGAGGTVFSMPTGGGPGPGGPGPNPNPVPAPATLALVALGLVHLGYARRRREGVKS